MSKLRVLALAIAAFFLIGTIAPSRAQANTTDAVIIVGSIIGGLIVVAIIATIAIRQHNKKKIFKLDEARGPENDDAAAQKHKVGFLTQCPMTAQGRPMVCW
jgi:spore maturation protein SpmA